MGEVKLYRSRSNRMIAGVCGGLGAYLKIDPIFIRLLFILLLFGSRFGFILYVLLWILVPEEGRETDYQGQSFGDRVRSMGNDIQQAAASPHPQAGLIIGLGLIIIGGILFIEQLDLQWLSWWDVDIFWPLVLIVGGMALLLRQIRGGEGR